MAARYEPQDWLAREDSFLAPYAMHAGKSRGRRHAEEGHPYRTIFQRDRERIVHSTAFRRLMHKTQVIVAQTNDHHRTRLTHTLEVAGISRTIARRLGLNEDLTEAVALSHDLGHPPFGHAGERALGEAMAPYGGFDHNAQSFRVVTRLERKYAAFDGLNLTLETLEGLAKHNGPVPGRGPGGGLLHRAVAEAGLGEELRLAQLAPAEAQAAAIADDIAYNSHDLDDGLRAGLLALADLADVPLAGPFVRALPRAGLEAQRAIYEVNRRIITAMIEDVVATSRARLAALPEQSLEGVRAAEAPVIALSTERRAEVESLQDYLFANLYRHPRVMAVMTGAETIVRELFARFLAEPRLMPEPWSVMAERDAAGGRARVVADFVAGMTDRYAVKEHRRLFAATPELG